MRLYNWVANLKFVPFNISQRNVKVNNYIPLTRGKKVNNYIPLTRVKQTRVKQTRVKVKHSITNKRKCVLTYLFAKCI